MRNLLCIQNKSSNFNERAIPSFNLNSLEIWKLCSIFVTLIVEMTFLHQRYWSSNCFERLFNCPWLVNVDKRKFLKRNNFWGSLAFFENVLRFSKTGSFNLNLFMKIPVKVLSENLFLANVLVEFSAPLVTHWTPLSTLDLDTTELQRKSSWDRSTIEMTTIEVRSALLSTRD